MLFVITWKWCGWRILCRVPWMFLCLFMTVIHKQICYKNKEFNLGRLILYSISSRKTEPLFSAASYRKWISLNFKGGENPDNFFFSTSMTLNADAWMKWRSWFFYIDDKILLHTQQKGERAQPPLFYSSNVTLWRGAAPRHGYRSGALENDTYVNV